MLTIKVHFKICRRLIIKRKNHQPIFLSYNYEYSFTISEDPASRSIANPYTSITCLYLVTPPHTTITSTTMLQRLLTVSRQIVRPLLVRLLTVKGCVFKKECTSQGRQCLLDKSARFQKRHHAISTDGRKIEDLIDHISDSQYCQIADNYLEDLSDSLEELGESYPQIDVELTQGVMSLTVAPGKTYVINKQPPNKQIWLSSPISGPKRYDLIGGKWITLRDNTALTDLLREELNDELECEVELSVSN